MLDVAMSWVCSDQLASKLILQSSYPNIVFLRVSMIYWDQLNVKYSVWTQPSINFLETTTWRGLILQYAWDILARLKKIRGNITLACLINLCFSTTTLSIFVTCFKGKEIISWYDHAYMISNAIKINNTHGLADTIIFII